MKIFLVRHGETKENGTNIGLTTRGIEQAKEVAKRLIQLPISKIYSSNLKRAKQTAKEYLKLNKSVKYIETARLKEIYRVLIGGPEKREEKNPEGRKKEDKINADNMWNTFLKEKQNILVFSHANIIRYFINKILKKKGNLWEKMKIGYASVSVIEFKNRKLKIIQINNKLLKIN